MSDNTIDHDAERARMFEEIGAAFQFAWMAYQLDTRYQTIEKRYRDQQPGRYWVQLAKQVVADYTADYNAAHPDGYWDGTAAGRGNTIRARPTGVAHEEPPA